MQQNIRTKHVSSLSFSTTEEAISPVISIDEENFTTQIYSVESVMKQNGYTPVKRLAKTLQGCVWKVKNKENQSFIIKVTKKSLYDDHVTIIKGKAVKIQEDILQEAAILQYLTKGDPPVELVLFVNFFDDDNNYFLVQEFGGTDLFSFITKSHKLIEQGIISLYEWQRFCKFAIKQMVNIMDWLHNTMHCCHLDVSIENFVINEVLVDINEKNQVKFNLNFQIKLIDFGLSEVFGKNKKGSFSYKCSKFVGKPRYKSPEIVSKTKYFDARAADCWSLGVIIFSMITGTMPFLHARKSDKCYETLINGDLYKLLFNFHRAEYVTKHLFDLMFGIFKLQKERLNISQIKNHKSLMG